MVPDWKALLPHRPLDPGSDQYVLPPTGGAERIANWILADRTTVLVAGPVGIGKSTELARAAELLSSDRVACLVRLDRFENMRRATVDQLLLRIAGQVAESLGQPFVQLSHDLGEALSQAGVLSHDTSDRTGHTSFRGSALTVLKLTLAEVSRSRGERISLLLDGLEKLPDGPGTLEFFEALGMLSDEVDIVAVLPWSLAFGAETNTVIRAGEHIVVLRAPDVARDGDGRQFLRALLAKRLDLSADAFQPTLQGSSNEVPSESRVVFERATRDSGGLPRTFLQLVADAGTYARIRRRALWPNVADLADAITEQQESFLRLLRPGDSRAIQNVRGTDGRELEPERRVRLLTHGILLERSRNGSLELDIHPLVEPRL